MSRWSGVSLTCPQQVVRIKLVEDGEQYVRHEDVAHGRHVCTDATRKLLPWNFGLTKQLNSHQRVHVCYQQCRFYNTVLHIYQPTLLQNIINIGQNFTKLLQKYRGGLVFIRTQCMTFHTMHYNCHSSMNSSALEWRFLCGTLIVTTFSQAAASNVSSASECRPESMWNIG